MTHTRYFNTETGGTTGYLKLNSNRIYILTSENTASSSELVISSLNDPSMNIILIGELTEGKNVGMQKYSDDQYEWRIGLLLQKLPMLYIQTIVPDLPPITIGTSLI